MDIQLHPNVVNGIMLCIILKNRKVNNSFIIMDVFISLTSHFNNPDVFLQCSYGDTIVGMLEYRISSSETIIKQVGPQQ